MKRARIAVYVLAAFLVALNAMEIYAAPRVKVQTAHPYPVHSVAFSPDGKMAVSGSSDNYVRLWDVASGKEIAAFIDPSRLGEILSVAFSPDGRTILSGGWNDLWLWDIATGKRIREFEADFGDVFAIAFSPDGKTILSGSGDTILQLWDTSTGRELREFEGHTDEIFSVAFSPDGKTILSASADSSLKLWDASSGKEIRSFLGHSEAVRSVAFSPDGKTALSGSSDMSIRLWDIATGKELKNFIGHLEGVSSVAFSPDGGSLISGSGLGNISNSPAIRLWDIATGKEIWSAAGRYKRVHTVGFSPDGKTIISGADDGSIKLWDAATGRVARLLGYSDSRSWSAQNFLAALPDGGRTFISCASNLIDHWDMADGRLLRSFSRLDGRSSITGFALSADGKNVIAARWDGVRLWNVASGDEVEGFLWNGSRVNAIAFSPDGTKVLYEAGENILLLREFATGKILWDRADAGANVNALAFSPDGKMAVSGALGDYNGPTGTLKLWDIDSGSEIRTFPCDFTSIYCAAFSPDGRMVVSGGGSFHKGKSINLFEVATGQKIKTFAGAALVRSVAYSPNGKTILSSSAFGPIQHWDITTGREILCFAGHSDGYEAIQFSPDGRIAVSCSTDGTVRVWNPATGELLTSSMATFGGEWITWTPDGYFNGTPWAMKNLVYAVDGLSVYGIDRYFEAYHRPDIIASRLSSGTRP